MQNPGTAVPKPPPAAPKPGYEDRLPAWQRHTNIFCENWIFAVLVALVIRHFLLEPFRIPTASMEPMLYGDAALLKGDFVVVDKVSSRFSAPARWDVTVFQYPVPEVDAGGGEPRFAEISEDDRRDHFPLSPLFERNFVKRCVILPGDVFYFANGDLFLRQPDGTFRVERKPPAVQQALWLPIYRAGVQPAYRPWEPAGGATLETHAAELLVNCPAGGTVRFTQPFSNFYLKPGETLVEPRPRVPGGPEPRRVAVSMLAPFFAFPLDGGTMYGNVWDLDRWTIRRVTTADDDDPRRQRELNPLMTESVGDIRLRFVLAAVTGEMVLQLAEGEDNRIDLRLASAGWSLMVAGREVAAASGPPTGRSFELSSCDDLLRFSLDGNPLLPEGIELKASGAALDLRLSGTGSCRIADLTIDRDVHYCRDGFLTDESLTYAGIMAQLGQRYDDEYMSAGYRLRRLRRQIIPCLVDDRLREECQISLDRARSSTRATAWLQPLGVDPSTAIHAPVDGYLMLGDNSPLSLDGRSWGWVPASNIRGRVLWVVFPFNRMRVVR